MKLVGASCYRGRTQSGIINRRSQFRLPRGSSVPTAKSTQPVFNREPIRPGSFLFLVGGGLSSGGGLAVVGDLLAGMRSFGGGIAHVPICFGVVPGHFGDEGLQGVVAC
jgi:hypothetical protein